MHVSVLNFGIDIILHFGRQIYSNVYSLYYFYVLVADLMSRLKTVIIAGVVGVVSYNIGHANQNSITLGPAVKYVDRVEVRKPTCPAVAMQKKTLDKILFSERRALDTKLADANKEDVYDPGTWSKKIADFIGIAATAKAEGFYTEEGDALSNAIGTANSALPFGVVWWVIGVLAIRKIYNEGVEAGKKQR